MRLILLMLTLFLCSPALAEENPSVQITPEITLKAIQLYREDPTTEKAISALSIATMFAAQSEQVSVVVQQDCFPFELGSIDPEAERRFVGAFLAGNVEHQLLHQIKRDSPYEGVTLELFTYKILRDKGSFPKTEVFELWLHWQEEGELKQKLKLSSANQAS